MNALASRGDPAPLKNAVWGSEPGDVFAVGEGDRIRRIDFRDGRIDRQEIEQGKGRFCPPVVGREGVDGKVGALGQEATEQGAVKE